jgi:FlaA1/EpsC-like NDP-sugar epimerase
MSREEKLGFTGSLLMRNRLAVIVAFHLLTAIAAYAGAFYIRFDLTLPDEYFRVFYRTLVPLLVSRMVAYYYYKTYSASWRFAYLRDLIDVMKAVLLGSTLFLASLVFLDMLAGFPRSVLIIEALLSAMLVAGTKLIVRYRGEYSDARPRKITENVLIVGAGKAGVLLLNEIRTNKDLAMNVAGFVDDDPYKRGMSIQGVPVLGAAVEMPGLVKTLSVDAVIIAIPSSRYKDIVRIKDIARGSGVEVKVLPSLGRLIQDGTYTSRLKDVSTDDLLGRRVIKFCRESDNTRMKEEIRGKAVLVTGAGGSIGSELCRQVCQFVPRVLVAYDRYENSLYDLELEMRRDFPSQLVVPVIGDILDGVKLDGMMKGHSVDLVYHAAAYKHVPMMEREPIEAVRNNVLGTMNVARLAIANKVGKFVLISTDKAVNPANVMGATKRVAELLIQGLNGNGTRLVAVRFGNVIGSNGSVIPLFRKQIALGGPITVTHPEMTRYFMSIPEAVQLVMIAGAMGSGGEIFLLDMGEPVKIVDLARELIRLSGLDPDRDIDIVFSGVRPGEKLHEELYWLGEGIAHTENKKITMLKQDGGARDGIFEGIEGMKMGAEKGDANEVRRLLAEIVPEYRQG